MPARVTGNHGLMRPTSRARLVHAAVPMLYAMDAWALARGKIEMFLDTDKPRARTPINPKPDRLSSDSYFATRDRRFSPLPRFQICRKRAPADSVFTRGEASHGEFGTIPVLLSA